MIENDFWKLITVNIEDVAKGKIYLNRRGIDDHIYVATYLSSIKEKPSYCEIASAMRYDKRIRRVLFKYIGFLEEYIRAFITNKYSYADSALNKTKIVIEERKNKSLYEVLISITFGNLISQVKKLSAFDKADLFENKKILGKDLDAIIGLRNEVCHNRFLLSNKDLKGCSVGENGGFSLWANITNLGNYLPNYLRDNFINEINETSNEKINKYDDQPNWIIIPELIIYIAQ